MLCNICPRKCNVDRSVSLGYCQCGDKIKIAKYMLHKWEEPVISGKRGSGAVFFSGCNLMCKFCQNYDISNKLKGYEITCKELSLIFLKLQDMGAHNINLVTPTHYSLEIVKALRLVKNKLKIPVVYNCGGYEREETISFLAPYTDIFIQDIKYGSEKAGKEFSDAPDYFEVAKKATKKMLDICSNPLFDDEGIMQKGVIIRHLVLPGYKASSYKVIDFLSTLDKDSFILSLMSQFVPNLYCKNNNILNRTLRKKEYEYVLNYAMEKGLSKGYIQGFESADEKYIPEF